MSDIKDIKTKGTDESPKVLESGDNQPVTRETSKESSNPTPVAVATMSGGSWRGDAIDSIIKSLSDCRSAGAILHLEELITRINKNTEKESFRITDSEGTEITSVDDIIGYLDVDNCEFTRVRVGTERYPGSLTGVRVLIKDLFVHIDRYLDSDLILEYGSGLFRICLVANYYADLDKEVPLKVSYVSLSKIGKHTDIEIPEHLKKVMGVGQRWN